MGKLTTHVLDTVQGGPAAGVRIELRRVKDGKIVASMTTNADGRGDKPLLEGESLLSGEYELLFMVREYFMERGVDSPFLDRVPVRFVVFDTAQNYHVPLLVSPWAYSTYRGS